MHGLVRHARLSRPRGPKPDGASRRRRRRGRPLASPAWTTRSGCATATSRPIGSVLRWTQVRLCRSSFPRGPRRAARALTTPRRSRSVHAHHSQGRRGCARGEHGGRADHGRPKARAALARGPRRDARAATLTARHGARSVVVRASPTRDRGHLMSIMHGIGTEGSARLGDALKIAYVRGLSA